MRQLDTMQFDQGFQRIAGWLARGDRFLAEELRNEMHVAVAGMEPGKPTSYYERVAKCNAIDFMRSRARYYSYDNTIRHVSLQAARTTGYQIDTAGNIYTPERDNYANIQNEGGGLL